VRRRVREVSIRQRILRHNLRNSATVILGSLHLLETDDGSEEAMERLEREVSDLVDMANRAKSPNKLTLRGEAAKITRDLIPRINQAVRSCRETYPDAQIDVEAPESLQAPLPEYIDIALEELLENAVVHNGADQPHVRVSAQPNPTGQITLSIEDNGSGIPEVEKRTLQADYEQNLEHSLGLDLWLVKLITESGGGTLQFGESGLDGARVELLFPATDGTETAI
jgi:signal transduction histidine kinase